MRHGAAPQMAWPSEGFAGLVLRARGRTSLTQRDIATALGVHVRSVQLWEAGASHPNAVRMQGLIRLLLDAGGFEESDELAQAEALWVAAMTESSRLNTSFDPVWFSRLLADRTRQAAAVTASVAAPPRLATRQLLTGAPDASGFLSREHELQTLRSWLLDDDCRVVALLGMGGIGKTLLAARAAHEFASSFQYVFWRSLQNAPSFSEWLAGAIGFLSPQDAVLTATDDTRFNRLLELVSEASTLLILDNFDTVLQPGESTGGYLPGYAAYGELVQRLAEAPHRSCLLITSREEPPEFGPLKGGASPTRTLIVGGLAVDDARVLLKDKDLHGDAAAWDTLVARYTGNGLALKLIGETIHELFGGDIGAFMEDVAPAQSGLFGGVRQLLDAQIRRLSDLEQRMVRRLAVAREPVSFAEVALELADGFTRGEVREALEGLLRRSLLERRELGPTFTLQPVALEFVTEQLVEEAARDLASGAFFRLRSHPLVNATAKEYVRRTQERVIALPVLERLVALVGTRHEAERRILDFLDEFRSRPLEQHGYGPGNAVNLLRLLRGDLQRVDMSRLLVRQAYLQDVDAQDASFANAHLADSVLAEAFHQVSVELSPDGTHLLAGATTGEVCLWRAADRTLLLSLPGHVGMVWRVALSTARGLAASASEDGSARLWEAGSGRLLATLEGHTDVVQAVALSDDGALVASGSQDGSVKLWAAPEGELVRTLQSTTGGVLSLALNHDASLLMCGTQHGTISFWDVARGRLIANLAAHTGPIPGLALSADGRLLASASLDRTAKLWDVPSRRLRTSLEGHGGGVWNIALSRERELVASASQDGSVRIWSARTGEPLATLLGHTGEVWDVSLSADGSRIASAGQDGSVRLSDSATGYLLTSLHGHANAAWDVALSGDGTLAASGNQDGTISVWETMSGAMRRRLYGHSGSVTGITLSKDGRVLASASQDGSVKLWDPASGELRSTLTGHAAGTVWDVALSGDATLVASGGFDGTVKLWDGIHGQLLTTLRGHSRGVRTVALNDARRVVVSGSQDGSIKVWDNNHDGPPLTTLLGHTGSVQSVEIDTDGNLLISGGFDGTVKLWDVQSGECVETLAAHRGGVLCIALSANGQLLASGGFDRAVRMWDVRSGRLLRTMEEHTEAVWGLSLNSDATLLASCGFDGATRLWDLRSGLCQRKLLIDRPYERMDITDLTGVTAANRAALAALGAIDRSTRNTSIGMSH